MTARGGAGRDGSLPVEEITRAGRRMALGWDEQPVVVVPALDAAAAAVFPRRELLALDVDGGHAVARRVLHTALFLPLFLAMGVPFTDVELLERVGLPDHPVVPVLLVLVLAVLVVAVVARDLRTVVTWEMFAITAVAVAVLGIVSDQPVTDIIGMPLVLGLAAFATRRSRKARRVRWQRLRQIVDDHRLVETQVTAHGWHTSAGSAPGQSLRLVLASPQLPGEQWRAQLAPRGTQIDAAPETGDRVLVFVCPSDTAVAVVRPVLPD